MQYTYNEHFNSNTCSFTHLISRVEWCNKHPVCGSSAEWNTLLMTENQNTRVTRYEFNKTHLGCGITGDLQHGSAAENLQELYNKTWNTISKECFQHRVEFMPNQSHKVPKTIGQMMLMLACQSEVTFLHHSILCVWSKPFTRVLPLEPKMDLCKYLNVRLWTVYSVLLSLLAAAGCFFQALKIYSWTSTTIKTYLSIWILATTA